MKIAIIGSGIAGLAAAHRLQPHAAVTLWERMMKESGSNSTFDLLSTHPASPKRIDALISRAEMGQLSVRSPELERRTRILNRTLRRVISAVLFAALFVGGLIVLDRNETLGIVLLAVSGLPLLHALFAGVFSRRSPLP